MKNIKILKMVINIIYKKHILKNYSDICKFKKLKEYVRFI